MSDAAQIPKSSPGREPRSYTVAETAELYTCHRNTVRLTTLTSYGEVPFHRQRDLILAASDTEELIRLGRAVRAVTVGAATR